MDNKDKTETATLKGARQQFCVAYVANSGEYLRVSKTAAETPEMAMAKFEKVKTTIVPFKVNGEEAKLSIMTRTVTDWCVMQSVKTTK